MSKPPLRIHAALFATKADSEEVISETFSAIVTEGEEDLAAHELANWLRQLAGEIDEAVTVDE